MLLRFLAIVAVLSAAYLVGNGSTSLWDRDEPRYAQASRQMLQSGNWAVPQYLDEVRLKKPPMIYWLQATAMKWFGDRLPVEATRSARFPSALASVLAILLIGAAVAMGVDGRTAIWTAFIYGTSVLVIAAAKMCITDAVLTLFILMSQVCLYRIYIGRGGWATMIGLGAAVGLAGLTKGPVVLGVLATTIIALLLLRGLERWWPSAPPSVLPPPRRQLHPLRMLAKLLLVIGVILAIVGPWWHAVERQMPGKLWQTIWDEVIVRAARAQEGHSGPPGYYLLAVWVTFFPWSLLLPAALIGAWRLRNDKSIRFALAAVIGPWVMFELVATKLPHYILPTYAPLAYLVARTLIRSADGDATEFDQPHWPNVVAVWSVVVALIGIAPWLAAYFFHPLPWQTYVALGILSIWAVFYAAKVHGEFDRRYPAAAGMWMGLGMLGNVFLLYTGVFPVSQFMRLGERVSNLVPHNLAAGDAIMIDFKEPSLAFYQGGSIREQSDRTFLVKTPPAQWPSWIVMTDEIWQQMPEDVRNRLILVGQESGWNYSAGGRIVDVLVLRTRG